MNYGTYLRMSWCGPTPNIATIAHGSSFLLVEPSEMRRAECVDYLECAALGLDLQLLFKK